MNMLVVIRRATRWGTEDAVGHPVITLVGVSLDTKAFATEMFQMGTLIYQLPQNLVYISLLFASY